MISTRQKFWSRALKNLAACAGLLGFADLLVMYAIGTSHSDPTSGHIFRHYILLHDARLLAFSLTAREDFWYSWISVVSGVLLFGSVFAVRLIESYDPQSANLPPRPAGQDPLASRRK